jgi:hypothetical protein
MLRLAYDAARSSGSVGFGRPLKSFRRWLMGVEAMTLRGASERGHAIDDGNSGAGG